MALTQISFVFLSLFAIHQAVATWTPTKPTLELTCNGGSFDLGVSYAATASADYSQTNDLAIGDATGCAETGTAVDNTETKTITKTALSYGTTASPGCGAGAAFTTDATKMEYASEIKITMTVKKGGIQRVYIYKYNMKCTLTRSASATSSQAFTVANTAIDETVAPSKDETFVLGVTLEFVDDDDSAQPTSFTANNKDNLKMKIYEKPESTQLKFTVQKCVASNLADPEGTGALTADIISGECPVDESVTITDATSGTTSGYDISTRAFILSAAPDGTAYYLHCNIFVCLEAETDTDYAKCAQTTASDCTSKRKRRSVDDDDERMRGEIITSVQTFTIIDDAYTTDCPEGHVFDTLSKLCTQDRVFKILGVHLEKQWDSEYTNSSSTKFKWFAKNTAREIRALILATGVERQICGIKIIAARPGSVILDVLITYGEEIEPREAFNTFKNMLYHTTPQVSRLVNVLNVIKEKTVELVPVEMERKSSLDKNFIILVVFAVIAVAFISAITLYQVQKLRRQVPPVAGVTGIANSGIEKA